MFDPPFAPITITQAEITITPIFGSDDEIWAVDIEIRSRAVRGGGTGRALTRLKRLRLFALSLWPATRLGHPFMRQSEQKDDYRE